MKKSRLMYIENKTALGPALRVIGRVTLSKTGKTLYYKGLTFQSLKGAGFKSNYYEVESGGGYWISGPRKDQNDRLYGGNQGVTVDDDAEKEYADFLAS